MAFQSERALIKCAGCNEEFKFFKTMESENPDWTMAPEKEPTLADYYASQGIPVKPGDETQPLGPPGLPDTTNRGFSGGKGEGSTKRGFSGAEGKAPDSTKRGFSGAEGKASDSTNRGSSGAVGGKPGKRMRVCPPCELKFREFNKHLHGDDPDWATMTRVVSDMKKANKGAMWVSKGQHYAAATDIVEKMSDMDDKKLSQKEKARMKTAKCKELAEVFVKTIKNGRLFNAFVRAGERLKVGGERVKECEAAYKAYLNDPENVALLKRLEELEEEVAAEHEYTTAGGDTEVLKALDFHNDMSEGFNMYDCCRSKVRHAETLITMQCHVVSYEHSPRHKHRTPSNHLGVSSISNACPATDTQSCHVNLFHGHFVKVTYMYDDRAQSRHLVAPSIPNQY